MTRERLLIGALLLAATCAGACDPAPESQPDARADGGIVDGLPAEAGSTADLSGDETDAREPVAPIDAAAPVTDGAADGTPAVDGPAKAIQQEDVPVDSSADAGSEGGGRADADVIAEVAAPTCPPPPAACNGQASGTFCWSAFQPVACGRDVDGCIVAFAQPACAKGCVGSHPSAGCCVPSCAGKCGGTDGCGGTCQAACKAPTTCGGGTTPDQCGCPAPGCIDQSNLTQVNGGANVNEGERMVAQTYTAVLTGQLTAVAVDIFGYGTFPLRLTVRPVAGGAPVPTILGEVRLTTNASPLANIVKFASPIPQVAGQQYAIVADYPDAPPPGAGMGQASWYMTTGNPYPAGGLRFSSDGVLWTRDEGDDGIFKTFVTPH